MIFKVCPIVIFALSLLANWKCHASSDLYFDDIRVDFVNYSYFDRDTFDISVNYKPNAKNTITVRLDILQDLPDNSMLKLSISSRILGREVPTGISMDSTICGRGTAKLLFDILVNPTGITDCPPKKGSYGKEEFVPNLASLPIPWMPDGTSVIIKTHLHADDVPLLTITSFMTL